MPSRRAYLATLAAAGLAGCVGDVGFATESPTDTRPDVTVEAAAVQYAYRHIENVDWNGIQPADGQFVFVTVDARSAETTPSRESFSLAADGESYAPTEPEHGYAVDLEVPGDQYLPDNEDAEPRGWLVFDVPAHLDSAPSLRLELDAGRWEWDLDVPKATSPPPEWDWSASAPETVAPDATFDITITAENVGDGPGTFRGAVNFSYPLYRPKGFDIELDAGESGEASVSASAEGADSGKEIDYGVRTPVGETTVTVTVQDDGTATPTDDAN